MIDLLSDPQVWASLLTLTLLEVVLGIDNVIFLSIVSGRLPKAQQPRARVIGLGLAAAMRILLLFSITWIIGLTQPIFSVLEQEVSWRDLVLMETGAKGLRSCGGCESLARDVVRRAEWRTRRWVRRALSRLSCGPTWG
jgi:predicted tellurium resistance membrane protein TerC